VSWPDAEERRLLYGFFTSYEKAVGVLDGTHCQISVPYFKEERSLSGYKKLHTQNYMICADALGFVIHVLSRVWQMTVPLSTQLRLSNQTVHCCLRVS